MQISVSEQQIFTLNNLYSVLLLGGAVRNSKNKYQLKLATMKKDLLTKYIKRNCLEKMFHYEYEDGILTFESTINIIRLNKEVSIDNTKIDYISPSQLNVNVLNMWVALFGMTKNKRIYIPSSHFVKEARAAFVVMFNEVLNISLVHNSKAFMITNYVDWFIQLYQSRRPVYEYNILFDEATPSEINNLVEVRKNYDRNRGMICL